MSASLEPTLHALAAYAELSELASSPDLQAYVQPRKAAFEARTGPFATLDSWHDARMRAFHDQLATQPDFHCEVASKVDASLAPGRQQLLAAFRGLFRLQENLSGSTVRIVNLVDRAEYFVNVQDLFLRQALAAVEEAVFDGRLVVSGQRLALLPGAFLHPEEATKSIGEIVTFANGRGLSCDALLDRLMLMEHQLRVRSRVRANQVYRVDAL